MDTFFTPKNHRDPGTGKRAHHVVNVAAVVLNKCDSTASLTDIRVKLNTAFKKSADFRDRPPKNQEFSACLTYIATELKRKQEREQRDWF